VLFRPDIDVVKEGRIFHLGLGPVTILHHFDPGLFLSIVGHFVRMEDQKVDECCSIIKSH